MEISINDLLKNPESDDGCHFFYDWFAKESTLERRKKAMIPKIRFLVKEKLLDGDKHCVWFKNNAPFYGPTFDDSRISTFDDNSDFIGGFSFETYDKDHRARFWYFEDDEHIEHTFKDWVTLKNLLKTDEELRSLVRKHFNKDYTE